MNVGSRDRRHPDEDIRILAARNTQRLLREGD
jgi:hypothetical protein